MELLLFLDNHKVLFIKWGYFYKNINNFHSWSCIPEKQTENSLEYNCKIIFDYSYGLIHNGFLDILKYNIYADAMQNEYSIRNVDYRKTQEFREFADTCTKIYTTYLNRGLALQEGV